MTDAGARRVLMGLMLTVIACLGVIMVMRGTPSIPHSSMSSQSASLYTTSRSDFKTASERRLRTEDRAIHLQGRSHSGAVEKPKMRYPD